MCLTDRSPRRWWFIRLILLTLLGAVWVLAVQLPTAPLKKPDDVLLGLALLGVIGGSARAPRLRVGLERDSAGKPRRFTIQYGEEVITLDPGRAWHQLDHFKWVTRGVIDEPPGLHVHPDGAVDIGGERIQLADEDAPARLEQELSKRHPTEPTLRPAGTHRASAQAAHSADRTEFKVRLDHLGHLMIDCYRGAERLETSLRGLSSLIQNGLMLKPASLHVDPLQHYVELDAIRYEATETGAHELETVLNSRFAPSLKATGDQAIKIKENTAAATGFDIHFVTIRAGARFEVKGHFSQENLDILQDQAKCDLLRPGMILRISPPFLFVRRRRPDGGEDHLPELPDVQYRHVTASQLQDLLNHPALRRSGAATADATAEQAPVDTIEIHVGRNPQTKAFLWMTCVTNDGKEPTGKALTHHNIRDLQQAGTFLAGMDVNLSLDNRTLSVLNTETRAEQTLIIDYQSRDEDLQRAGHLLTTALRPPRPRKPEAVLAPIAEPTPAPPKVPAPTTQPRGAESATLLPPVIAPTPVLGATQQLTAAQPPTVSEPDGGPLPPAKGPKAPVAPAPPAALARSQSEPVPLPPPDVPPPALLAGFDDHTPTEVVESCFRQLASRFGIPIQEAHLSLPHVFSDRRFEILALGGQSITELFELRSEDFYGFYLCHGREEAIDFVYACGGTHIEFGASRCLIQTSLASEPQEFKGSALLGLAQNHAGHFVFVVAPGYRAWAKPSERACAEAYAHFITQAELSSDREAYPLIWPQPTLAD